MFIGHLAIGFAAKRAAPRASLGVLVAATELLDLLFPVFLLAGWEKVRIVQDHNPFTRAEFTLYPWSHSLAAACVWGLVMGGAYWVATRYRRGSIAVGLLVVSHWVLDAISHTPDMPLYPGPSPRIGLGLWNSVPGTMIVEGAMFTAGVWLYARHTRARDRIGTYGLWSFVLVMTGLYAAMVLGPRPPDASAMGWAGLLFALFLFWIAWFDRHREPGGGVSRT